MQGKNTINQKGLFDMWVKTAMGPDRNLYLMEEGNGVKLFKLQTWFWSGNRRYGESPTYHVWAGDRWECATLDYQEALRVYEDIKREGKTC